MRFVTVYLGIYFALVVGALIALWAGGVLGHLPPLLTLTFFVLAAALGLLTALVWRWDPHRAVKRS